MPPKQLPYRLSNISIQAVILALQELLLDQAINVTLDAADFQRAPVLRGLDRLANQFRMADPLPRLEDPDDCGLGFVVAVSSDTFVGFLVFLRRFFELHGVDLDSVLGVGEVAV